LVAGADFSVAQVPARRKKTLASHARVFFASSVRGFVLEGRRRRDYDAGVVEPPGVVEPEPGVVPGVAGAGEAGGVPPGAGVAAPGAGVVAPGAGVVAPGVGLVAGAGASSFLLQALSATASTEAIIKVLLIII
ncbi:hypothetical protein, partial [Achromobacter mucicolens]|uniref:hypothetical protein n=1 Tax=Achromobacter mucicolens TaxID=1389922 RepID=UPI003D72751E